VPLEVRAHDHREFGPNIVRIRGGADDAQRLGFAAPLPDRGAAARLPGEYVEPVDFIAKLAALVPKPRVDLTRYHGVFAPKQPSSRPGNAG
jgi:hypothetical protein